MQANQSLDELDTNQPDYESFDESKLEGSESVEAAEGTTDENKAAAQDEQTTESTEPEQKPVQPTGGQNYIPRHRYNFAQQKRVEAEQRLSETETRLKELEAQVAAQKAEPQQAESKYTPQQRISAIENAVAELDQQIEDARADGNTREAARLQSETRRLERALSWEIAQLNRPEQQPVPDSNEATRRAIEAIKTETTIYDIERQFPMLQEGNQLFDGELSDEVMDVFDSFVKTMPPQDALIRAVSYVTSAYGIQPLSQQFSNTRSTNVKRNLAAANSQPPDMHQVGMDSNTAGPTRAMDVMKMTQDDFERLGDSDIEKLLV